MKAFVVGLTVLTAAAFACAPESSGKKKTGGTGGSSAGGAKAGSGGRGGTGGTPAGGTGGTPSGGTGGTPAGGTGGTPAGGSGGSVAGKTALYVVGDDVLLSPGEEVVQFRLESRGFAVTDISGGFATAQDAVGMNLMLISETPPSMVINTTFRDVATPMVCMERNLFDDNGMTGQTQGTDYGDDSGVTSVQIAGGSVMGAASGLTGTVMIAFEGGMVGWGATLGATADKAASNDGAPTHWSLFGYKRGAAMPGLTAPAARVGYGPWAGTAANFTEEGLKLLDAAVDYALAP